MLYCPFLFFDFCDFYWLNSSKKYIIYPDFVVLL